MSNTDKKYIMALDQGTTSSRCILFDHEGQIVSVSQKPFEQIYPQPGWVEHDPMTIWSTQIGVAAEACAQVGADSSNIAAIGITNQRETTIVWDKNTGKPIANAIVWQCRRTSGIIDALDNTARTKIRQRTGLIPDAYFSATKIKWLLDNTEGAREAAEAGNLLFGTVDTWLLWNLTGRKVHATDYTNASRTMLYDIHKLCWDKELLDYFGIPESMMPEVHPSGYNYGYSEPEYFAGSIPICSLCGDQQSSLFGLCCFDRGEVKNTYGTGCFLLMNTGQEAISSQNGLLTTIAGGLKEQPDYALEGSIYIGGAVIQWLRDEMKLIANAAESEELALKVENTAGVYLVPSFTGLGAPYWQQDARGTMVGITRGFNRSHMVRAALESICYQTMDVIRAMEADSGVTMTSLKADGGASVNNFLMQFQSDIVGTDIICYKMAESTALGTAYLAGLCVGFWKDPEELKNDAEVRNIYKPVMNEEEREEKTEGWHKAVETACHWAEK